MDRLLITQSLLSSWSYLYSCREESHDDAYYEFLQTLRRDKAPPNEAMLAGREFEDEVYKVLAGVKRTPHAKWEKGILAVASQLRGAPVQVKVQREIQINGYPLLLYGVLDALKAGIIFDVKFSTKSFTSAELAGKYLDSVQHPAYLELVPEAHEFTYLVSDGEDLYQETYLRRNTRSIVSIIKEFLGSIEVMGLVSIYKEKWRTA